MKGMTRGVCVIAAAAGLAASGTALAARPHAGKHYRGFAALPRDNGFRDPVSFSVSTNGDALANFTYSYFGCFANGSGEKPGIDYWLRPAYVHKVSRIGVDRKGRFSVTNAKESHKVNGQTIVTKTSVKGRFATASKATGTITLSQRTSFHGQAATCPPISFGFTATVK